MKFGFVGEPSCEREIFAVLYEEGSNHWVVFYYDGKPRMTLFKSGTFSPMEVDTGNVVKVFYEGDRLIIDF